MVSTRVAPATGKGKDGKDKKGKQVTTQATFTVSTVSPVVAKEICRSQGGPGQAEVEEGRPPDERQEDQNRSAGSLFKTAVLCQPATP